MKSAALLRILSGSVLALLIHVALVAQMPFQATEAQLVAQRVVAELNRAGEHVEILERRDALRSLDRNSVGVLLAHENQYIKALAIGELTARHDPALRVAIQRLFSRTFVNVLNRVPDLHDADALPADAAVLAASAEYLSAHDGAAFLPVLLSRSEVWSAPHWFVPAFRRLGAGWIRTALASTADPRRRSALGVLIRASATSENVPELEEALASRDAGLRASGLVACERLDDGRCWTALESSIAAYDTVDRLRARMVQWRRGRASADDLLAAADVVAAEALEELPGPERARMWNALYELLRLSRAGGLEIAPPLSARLAALGSPVIAGELAATRLK
jgi:hypothetical protein